MKKIILVFFTATLFAFSYELPRQGSLGVNVKPEAGMSKAKIVEIFEGGTADKMGAASGDIILAINDENIQSFRDLFEKLKKYHEGDEISLKVERNGNAEILTAKMEARPKVKSEGFDVIYSSVPFKEGHLRSYIYKPKGEGKFPTVYYIQGYPCQDVEYNHPMNAIRQMIEGLVANGYAVYRIEKPGMGDSHNTPECAEINFATELEAFSAGYEQLLKEDFVDKENIFVYGHSLGGYVAPYLANQYSPNGIIVYGTGLYNWQDYLLEVFRTQYPMYGIDHATTEKMINDSRRLFYEYFVLEKSPQEIIKTTEDQKLFQQLLQYDGGETMMTRHYSFWSDLNNHDAVKEWSQVNSKFLGLYGEYDLAALSPEAVERIADIINSKNPGNGEFKIIPETEHGYLKVPGFMEGQQIIQQKGYTKSGDLFNEEVVDVVVDWMEKNK